MFSFLQQTKATEEAPPSVASQVGGGGTDFNLPEEILAVLPTDPYEQLDLARKITSMAIASRVSKMEGELGRMREKMFEKDRIIYELEDKVSRLQQANQDAESRFKIVFDENIKLSKERDLLAMTGKKLSRELSKLETFKQQLMQSLSDDNVSQAETVDIGTCDPSVPKAYPDQDDGMSDYTSLRSSSGSMDMGSLIDEGHSEQRFSASPYNTRRLPPSESLNILSTSYSSRGYTSAGGSSRVASVATSPTSPTKSQFDGLQTSFSGYLSSQQSSAANSPPRRHTRSSPRIDGKEFFRQARSQLSYEQFGAFLANIKELNAQKQTREETLRKAEEIFGTDNKDLYISFQGLLNRRNIR